MLCAMLAHSAAFQNNKIKHRAAKNVASKGEPLTCATGLARRSPVSATEELKNATQFTGPLFPIKAPAKAAPEKRAIKPEERLAKNSAYLRARRARWTPHPHTLFPF